jgi:hypothetical protein
VAHEGNHSQTACSHCLCSGGAAPFEQRRSYPAQHRQLGRIWFVGRVIYSVLSAGGFFLGLFLYAMTRRLNLPMFDSLADVKEAARKNRQPIILVVREFTSDATHNTIGENFGIISSLRKSDSQGRTRVRLRRCIGRPGE